MLWPFIISCVAGIVTYAILTSEDTNKIREKGIVSILAFLTSLIFICIAKVLIFPLIEHLTRHL